MPLRLAIAGANATRGWARDAHIAAIAGIPDLVLDAVSARTSTIADTAATAFGARRAFDDTLTMVRDPQIDVVAVTVKVPEHRAIVLAALDAGKHVYCEWPLGRDLAETRELAEAALRAGTHCAIGTQAVAATAVRKAAQLVRDGAIGALLSLRVVSPTAGWGDETPRHYAYLQDRLNGATLSTIAGGHTLAAIQTVVGRYVEVDARNSILHPRVRIAGAEETVERTSPDHVAVIGRHEGGCISTLEVVGGVVDVLFRFELRGTRGTLEIVGGGPGGFQAGKLSVRTTPAGGPPTDADVTDHQGPPANVAALWTLFVADIRNGTRHAPGFDSAIGLAALLADIDHAAETGQRAVVGKGLG